MTRLEFRRTGSGSRKRELEIESPTRDWEALFLLLRSTLDKHVPSVIELSAILSTCRVSFLSLSLPPLVISAEEGRGRERYIAGKNPAEVP